jgi:hypothetical protein
LRLRRFRHGAGHLCQKEPKAQIRPLIKTQMFSRLMPGAGINNRDYKTTHG